MENPLINRLESLVLAEKQIKEGKGCGAWKKRHSRAGSRRLPGGSVRGSQAGDGHPGSSKEV